MSDHSPAPITADPGRVRRSIRLLHITDFHILAIPGHTLLGIDTEQSLAETLEAIRESGKRADLALVTGDLVQDPDPASYRRLRKLLEMDWPCHCLPGNHDDPALIQELLIGGRIHNLPEIVLDGWQIICLNSTIPGNAGGHLGEEQLRRLEETLAARPEHYALIALHHHPVRCGSRWMDTMLVDNADRLFAVLDRYPQARALVFGHVHQAMDLRRGPLRLLGTPSTCFQFKPDSVDFALDLLPAGYRWIELRPDGSLDTTVERLARIPSGLDFASVGY